MLSKEETKKLIQSYNALNLQDAVLKEEFLMLLDYSEEPFNRNTTPGHITCSAWVTNKNRTHVLLTHHLKIDKWFQLGGHVEETDTSLMDTALREIKEESGLKSIFLVTKEIFDIDIHQIPARPDMKAHEHYDVRFLIEADWEEPLMPQSSETKEVKWVGLADVAKFNNQPNILRMINKLAAYPRL